MSRGGDDPIPPEYAISELNVEYTELGVESRAGFDLALGATGNWNGVAARVYEFKKRNEASRLLILDDQGNIWDSSTALMTPILSIAAMTDFSAETMYDKVFISPHDGERGLSNEKIYVYDGTGSARVAAGGGPSGYTLEVADDADAGYIDAGLHLFSVAFETTSGHITKFGLNGAEVKQYTAPGGKKANITGIPVGGASIVARWIVCTKVIDDYDGNPSNQSWYLLHRIGNNVDTTLNDVSFFDSALIDSADRLLNQLAEIPAGSCIVAYGSRLVVGGEIANDATARVSDAGYPEAFSGLSGFVNFNPGDSGGALRLLISYRDMLFGFKDYRTLVTQDNGASPSSWRVNGIDDGHGTSVHGSSGVLDSKGQSLDSLLICTRSGISRFTGTYGDGYEITYMIEDLWRRINPLYFHLIQIAIDPVQKKFYVVVPLDVATTPDFMLVCDFSEGLSFDKVKWSVWEFVEDCSTCWVEVDWNTRKTKINYGSFDDGGLYVRNPSALNDHNNAISSHYRPGYVTADQSGGVCQFQEVRARVVGEGTLYLKIYGIDDIRSAVLPSLALSESPGRILNRGIGFFDSERASVEFGVTSINHWFHLTKILLASSVLWEQAWQT
jgi:hypothetical protein